MKAELVKLIDTTKCTACRGCQIACKQWNNLPGLRTKNRGSYQNPPDLQWNTWTLIRFQEYVDPKGQLKWLFRKDGCMHCTDAACVKVCPSGALYHASWGPWGSSSSGASAARSAPRPAPSRSRATTAPRIRSTSVTCARTGSRRAGSPPASSPAPPGRSRSARRSA